LTDAGLEEEVVGTEEEESEESLENYAGNGDKSVLIENDARASSLVQKYSLKREAATERNSSPQPPDEALGLLRQSAAQAGYQPPMQSAGQQGVEARKQKQREQVSSGPSSYLRER
jgi:hypothetical protein